MPPPCFKSFTVSEEFFDWFDNIYKINKECGTLNPGITSFGLFFAEQTELAIKEHFSMRVFISKIKYVPKTILETLLQIKII